MDRPDEVRRVINFKRLAITEHKVDIPRLAKKKVLAAALEESGERLPSLFLVCRTLFGPETTSTAVCPSL